MIEAKAKVLTTGLCECSCEVDGTIKELLPEFLAIAKSVYETISEDAFAKTLFLMTMKNFDKINEFMLDSEDAKADILSKMFTEVFNDESKHQQD